MPCIRFLFQNSNSPYKAIKTVRTGAQRKRGIYLNAKTYLRSIKHLDTAISAKQKELDGLRKDAQNLQGVTYSGDKVQSNIVSDPTEIVDRIIDLQNTINAEIDRLVQLKAEARSRIARVYNPLFVALLTDRYINGFTLEEIAEIWSEKQHRHISEKTIYRWHGEALQIFRHENCMS